MKFLRSPKGVTAQRSRARHLAYKRRPIEAKPRDELIAAAQTVAAMLNLSPIAMRDYIEWLRSQPREKNREETNRQETSQAQAGTAESAGTRQGNRGTR